MARRVAKEALRRMQQSAAAQQTPRVISGALPEYTEVTTLPNGLRVATERSFAECETLTLGVWIDAGSRYEHATNNGVAHFLEHMAFKGTKKRAQRELEEMIENMGARLDAYTSREQTVYYAKLFRKDAGRGMEVLADILQNSLLDHRAIKRERDVILREMTEVNKQHEELILDLLHAAAYRDGGLGRTILGPEKNIRSITRSDLEAYIQTHYTAPRMVVAAAGALEHKDIVDLSGTYFSKQPRESQTDFAVDFDSARFTPTEMRVFESTEPLAHVCVAYAGANWTSEFSMPLMVLQTMIGHWDRLNPTSGGSASPYVLARNIAEEGNCHSYTTFNSCYKDAGLFGLYFVAPDNGIAPTLHCIQTYLASLAEPGAFDDHDVARARAQLKATIISQLDALAHVCEEIGRQFLTYNRRIPLVEILARIDAVSPEDVRATALKFLSDKDHALAAYGSISHLPPYDACHIRNFRGLTLAR